jgi:hypothetical protein
VWSAVVLGDECVGTFLVDRQPASYSGNNGARMAIAVTPHERLLKGSEIVRVALLPPVGGCGCGG